MSEELGVRYVLEGSIQKAGDRVRITAQLVDATKGYHLWAEKYDRELTDLFDLQDEITRKIVLELEVKLTEGEQVRISYRSTDNLEAWEYAMQGYRYTTRLTKEDTVRARELYKRALELDPEYLDAWVALAWGHFNDAFWGWSESPSESSKRAVEIIQKVLAVDDTTASAHALLGGIHFMQRQYDKAIAEGERAVALAPNTATYHVMLALAIETEGRWEEVIMLVKKAMRLEPYYEDWYLSILSRGYFFTGQYEEAIAACKELRDRKQNAGGGGPFLRGAYLWMAASYIKLGREKEARAEAAEVLKLDPNYTLEVHNKVWHFPATDKEFLLNALRKAGLK